MQNPKYRLQQEIFYMGDNKVCSARVLAYKVVRVDSLVTLPPEFGKEGVYYATCHGIYREDQVYGSKQELLETL